MLKKIKKSVIYFIVSALSLVSFVQPASAAMIGTDQVMAAQTASQNQAKIADALSRPEVASELERFGVSQADAEARVAALTDAEAAALASRIDSLPAGGDGLAVLGGIVLILIVTDLIGVTDIFPFINKANSSGSSGN
jgi:hypothetical protein